MKSPLVQGHPVVFGQFFVTEEKRIILPKKCWDPLHAVCEVLEILIRKLA